jgi:predicted GTPase
MSLNQTPSSERMHISFFGRMNAGKSSLVNALTRQELCVVSNVRGTTTDPVQKAMELLPLGPVVLIDTPSGPKIRDAVLAADQNAKITEFKLPCGFLRQKSSLTAYINADSGF